MTRGVNVDVREVGDDVMTFVGYDPAIKDWVDAVLLANGIESRNVCRVILDVTYKRVAKLYVEKHADEKTFDVKLADGGFEVVTNEAKSND